MSSAGHPSYAALVNKNLIVLIARIAARYDDMRRIVFCVGAGPIRVGHHVYANG